MVNSLLRQSSRVRIGFCIAQIVNVIAPLVTSDTSVLRQTIYYPYALALQYARGRVLDLVVECETHPIRARGLRPDFARDEQVPFVDVVATIDAPNRRASVLMLNRDLVPRPPRASRRGQPDGVQAPGLHGGPPGLGVTAEAGGVPRRFSPV